MPYVKLDTNILKSTVWFDPAQRAAFLTGLLMAEPRTYDEPVAQLDVLTGEPTGWVVPAGNYGYVPSSDMGIAHAAVAPLDEIRSALVKLGSPESNSRTMEHGGRRMIRIEGGFLVLNYAKYREKDTTAAERMRNWRDRQKSGGFNALMEQQSGLCACCGNPFEKPFSRYVVQDHDHKTKKNRGLLCQSCNRVVGMVENGKPYSGDKSQAVRYLACYAVALRNITHVDVDVDVDVDVEEQGSNLDSVELETSTKKRDVSGFSEADPQMKLALYLFRHMVKNNPKAKEPNFQKWARTFDLMIRRDGRTVEEIVKIVKFSQNDDFWMTNILSPDKLRKQFDRLVLQEAKNGTNGRRSAKDSRGSSTPSRFDKFRRKDRAGKPAEDASDL